MQIFSPTLQAIGLNLAKQVGLNKGWKDGGLLEGKSPFLGASIFSRWYEGALYVTLIEGACGDNDDHWQPSHHYSRALEIEQCCCRCLVDSRSYALLIAKQPQQQQLQHCPSHITKRWVFSLSLSCASSRTPKRYLLSSYLSFWEAALLGSKWRES